MMLELFFSSGLQPIPFSSYVDFFLFIHPNPRRPKFLREVRQMLQIVVVENHPLTLLRPGWKFRQRIRNFGVNFNKPAFAD